MTSSVHPSELAPASGAPRSSWSLHTAACPRGVALAREKGWALAWDENSWLYLLNRAGERQSQRRVGAALVAACCADDGSAYAAVGGGGEIAWLAPDLTPRWETNLPQRAVAVALDPFGQYLAAADARGGLHFFDRRGRPLAQAANPRPLHHVAFVPEAPFVVAAADYGFVAWFDLSGRCVWHDRLVANIGSLAVSADGARIVVACYTEGLRSYSLAGKPLGRQNPGEACRLVCLTADGRLTLMGGLSNRLLLLDREGQTLTACPLERPAVAVALAPLGDRAVAALPDRRVIGLLFGEASRA